VTSRGDFDIADARRQIDLNDAIVGIAIQSFDEERLRRRRRPDVLRAQRSATDYRKKEQSNEDTQAHDSMFTRGDGGRKRTGEPAE
jgi:hypothetical protein